MPPLRTPATKPIKILIIEHCASDAHLLRVLLRAETHYALTIAPQLARGICHLVKDKFDLSSWISRYRIAQVIEAICHVRLQ